MSGAIPQTPPSAQEPRTSADTERTERVYTPVRLRTYILGLLLVFVVCVIVAYAELVASRGGSVESVMLGSVPMAPAAVGAIIILLLANALVRKLARRVGLNSAELAVIYFMLVCAAMVSSFGLAGTLLPNLVGVNYYASAQDHAWRRLFYPHIPKWLVPWDPKGPEKQWVSQRFFEGLRTGEHVPWADWVVPLLAWLTFAFLLFFLMACVATLVRRQWVDNEKLSFPLVQLPMEMVNEETAAPFFRSRAMWLGFAIPVLFHCMNGVHKALPNVPEVQTLIWMNQWFKAKPFSDINVLGLIVSFSIVGFAYLLPTDVSFSMWFFLLFFRVQDLIGSYLGYQFDTISFYGGTRYYQGFQSAGAFAAIVVMMFWLARPHLRTVAQRVFSGEKSEADRDEYVSYRTAFWGTVFSLVLILIWLKAAGMSPFVALFMIGVFVFVVMLVLTRCVSEIGLLMLQPAVVPLHFWNVFASTSTLSASNLATHSFLNGAFMRDPRNVMPALMDSMRGADYVGARKKRVAVGTFSALAVGSFVALFFQVALIYKYGGMRLNTWFFGPGCNMYFMHAQGVITNPPAYDVRAPVWFSAGALFTVFLYAMRGRFWWWPFHPLGYAIGCAWPAIVYWSMFFVGWLIKSVILHYGGATTYRNFRPFFLGLILGEFSAAIIWAILRCAFGLLTPSIPIS